jgi:hypothetical protein
VEVVEEVLLIVDSSTAYHVEYLQEDKYVEDGCEMSTLPVFLIVRLIKLLAIPVIQPAWEDIGNIRSGESPLDILLREEMISSEDNSVNDNDLVDGHAYNVLHHLP